MPNSTSSKINKGFTLLEVLIALVILGFGFLGAGKLLLTSVKANDSAFMRTVATQKAYSMLEAIRANRGAVASYATAYGSSYTTSQYNACFALAAPATAAAIAQCDVTEWIYQLSKPANPALPSGDGRIVVTTVLGTTIVTIFVRWDDTRAQCAISSLASCATSLQTVTLVSQIQ